MQCSDVQLELHEYLDGTLPDARQSAVAEHLSSCQACSKEAEAMTELTRMLRTGLKEWVGADACPPQVMARIEQEITPPKVTRSRKGWWMVAGAAAVLFFALFSPTLPGTDGQAPLAERLSAQLLHQPTVQSVQPLVNGRSASVQASAGQNGVIARVTKVESATDSTRIWYSVEGSALQVDADLTRYAPALIKGSRRYTVRRVITTARKGDSVELVAEFEPVSFDQAVTLEIATLPERTTWLRGLFKRPLLQGPWQVVFQPVF